MLTRYPLSVILLAFMAIVQVHATIDLSVALLERLYGFQGLEKRQTSSTNNSVPLSDFPQQCQGGCKLSIDALNTCSAATCLCNSTVEASLNFCINCSVNEVPTTSVIQSGQQVVDTYNTLCKGVAGVSTIILNITVSTEAGSSTVNGSATSIAIGSGTTTSLSPGIGPTTTITSLPSIAVTPAATGASGSIGPAASTAVGTGADVRYAFIVLIIALFAPLLV
ncbi:hypothetical protein AX14_000307 [Amanita brunnescens Koide BX004]|nr:hypothetical protein AX14_000307 [Amanita brunnescens Koide BX004]